MEEKPTGNPRAQDFCASSVQTTRQQRLDDLEELSSEQMWSADWRREAGCRSHWERLRDCHQLSSGIACPCSGGSWLGNLAQGGKEKYSGPLGVRSEGSWHFRELSQEATGTTQTG